MWTYEASQLMHSVKTGVREYDNSTDFRPSDLLSANDIGCLLSCDLLKEVYMVELYSQFYRMLVLKKELKCLQPFNPFLSQTNPPLTDMYLQ